MTIDRISFEQLFPTGEYANQRLRVEGTLTEGETIEDAFIQAKASVESSFKAANPLIEVATPTPSQLPETRIHKESQELRVANMIADIQSCQDLKVLETYKLLVKNNPQLQQVYDETAEKLKNK